MATPTIDHEEAVARFRQLLASNSPHRLLRVTGSSKMGKSHLLRVFREIAQANGIPEATVDLRQTTRSTRDLLYAIEVALRDQLDLSAYQEVARQAAQPTPITLTKSFILRSEVNLSTVGDDWDITRHLTMQLALDIAEADRPVVIFIDAVEQAATQTAEWLAQTLLTEMCRLPTVRVVAAGQTLPAPTSTYADWCTDVVLDKVEDPQAYITFCERAGIACPANLIPEVARILKYTPGLFVEFVKPAYESGS